MRVAALLLVLWLSGPAAAQTYPSRAIRLILPFAAGGLVDVPGRILAQKLSASLGQPLVVENRPGAGSTIGADLVAKAKPDGYLLMITSTTHVISANLYKSLPYDALQDFAPVMKLAEGPYVLAVYPGLPARSVRDLIALAKSRPDRIDYGSSGNGSSQHLVAALFCSMTGARLNHVPYKGSDRATQDLIGGQVSVGFLGTPGALPHLRSGRLRALAVSTARRSAELPDVPTLHEAGVPGFEATIWLGLFAPAATPHEVLARLQAEFARTLAEPDVRAAVASTGLDVSPGGAAGFAAFVRAEHEKWGRVVRETGATVN